MTSHSLGAPIGRIVVTQVSPVIEGGAYPAKASVGETIRIEATVFREGHDAVGAQVILTDPQARQHRIDLSPVPPAGFDRWGADLVLDSEGAWSFCVQGYSAPWPTWRHNAEIKIPAGIDVGLVCAEGIDLIERAIAAAEHAGASEDLRLLRAAAAGLSSPQQVEDRLQSVLRGEVAGAMDRHAPRELVTSALTYPIFCVRAKALFSAWYEFFPRSVGASYDGQEGRWHSGTFDSSHERLQAAAAMGFDVVYLPPIHPIGSSFRKGPNNTLDAGPGDPGSPWAIGNAEGGHDAIHPDLGDFAAFDRFVARAQALGLEVAMDFALQASPDHPWVSAHPEWFTKRLDGTIAYAENPPKKYQDIYPLNFDNDPQGIYAECLRLLRFWMDRGVRIFRVDNPHTKPIDFWAWLLAEVRRSDPDVIFLSEAFTRPEMMWMLAKIGFHQSYTYFTWRNEKWEIEEYLTELSQQTAGFLRPNFFVNTPDILPTFLQTSGRAGFVIRAVLAATLSPSWGVYSGFELYEHQAVRQGSEEYLDSEKYQYRPRNWSGADQQGETLTSLITTLNAFRNQHPALQQLRNLHFHHVLDARIIGYSRRIEDDLVIVVCSLEPHAVVESEIYLDMAELGLDDHEVFTVREELSGEVWHWGQRNFIRLSPERPAHLLTLTRSTQR